MYSLISLCISHYDLHFFTVRGVGCHITKPFYNLRKYPAAAGMNKISKQDINKFNGIHMQQNAQLPGWLYIKVNSTIKVSFCTSIRFALPSPLAP